MIGTLLLAAVTLAAQDTVVRVVDRDTIVTEKAGKVRLLGIDTPETKHPTKPVELCGREATAALEKLLPLGAEVTLIGPKHQGPKDRYDRTLAWVFVDKHKTVAQFVLLQLGLARVERRYPIEHLAVLDVIERMAKKLGMGAWGTWMCETPDVG